MNTLRPYIGITDFTNAKQVDQMTRVFLRHRKTDSNRMLHVGVMMSYKTLHGIETKWSKIFPPASDLQRIFFSGSEDVYRCLHYADYSGQTDYRDIARAIGHAGAFVDAIQLDMPWPDPVMIDTAIHTSRKQVEVILQIGKNALDQVGNDPVGVVNRLSDYENVIHRVLLDKSMGKGLGMDANALIPFAEAIRDRYPEIGLVVAGGLGPETMDLVKPLAERFTDLSIDAQGRLRPSGDALDPIDWKMAGTYLKKGLELLK